MSGKNVAYRRVSTLDQKLDRQLEGMAFDKTFDDKCSGKDFDRPQLQAMLLYLREGDTLTVHSLDRLARNMYDLQKIVKDLTEKGVVVHFVAENLTFSKIQLSPMNELMFFLLGAFSQFERNLIRERQREGIVLAKIRGKYKGKKNCLGENQIKELKAKYAMGVPKYRLAKDYKVSRPTIYRYLKMEENGRVDSSL